MSPPVQPLTPRRTANQRRVEEELQRWKDETAWELETQNDAIRQYQANTARNVRALEPGLARVPDPTVLEPVDSRPELHGPTPRGMRPSRLPARRGFLTEEQAKDLDDPYMNESDLYRRLAVLRYKGVPGAIMGAYQTGYETMVGVENLLGKIPYAGAPFRWLAEASHPGIDRVRAEEAVMRERHMGPVERGVTGLIRGVAEFELGTRALGPLGSILRAEAPVVAATQGARTRLGHFGARALAEAKNTLLRGSAAAAQFGAYEQGLATLQGESVEEAARRGREGAGTGALLGGGLPLAFKGLLKGAEGAARVARPVAKPLYEGFQETLRTGARGLLYTDARIREAAELRRATRNFTQGETVYWQGRAYKWDGKLGRAEDGTATVSLSTGHAGPDDVNNPWYPSEPAAPLTEVTRTPSGEPVIGMTPMAEGRVAERSRRIRESMEAELAERRQPVPSPDEARGMDYSDLAERLSPANRQRFRVGEDLHPVDEQGQPDHAARELIRRGVSGTAAAEAEAAAPAPPPGTKVRKGIYYFDYYQSARAYAEAHGLPTDRIIQYKRGWAVQLEKGGDYAGPRTPPRETPPPEQAGRGK
ncbi:MAG TPA: hypothetical protein VJN67_21455, partial [Stellaceae bacterium]|nr:hypothetical protein [Stellaceae bacterium]